MTATDAHQAESGKEVPLQEPVEEPRPTSWMSLAALLLGVSSFLVGLGSCFLVLPLLAIFLGALALWQTHEVEPVPRGRPAAWTGLFLGLFVVSGTIAYETTIAAREEAQVDALFEQFLKYLRQGDLAKAHQLTQEPWLRVDTPKQAALQYTSNPALKQALENFEGEPVVSSLRSARELELIREMTFAEWVEGKRKFLNRHYTFRLVTPSGEEKEITLEVVFLRHIGSQGIGAWQIHKFYAPLDQLF